MAKYYHKKLHFPDPKITLTEKSGGCRGLHHLHGLKHGESLETSFETSNELKSIRTRCKSVLGSGNYKTKVNKKRNKVVIWKVTMETEPD